MTLAQGKEVGEGFDFGEGADAKAEVSGHAKEEDQVAEFAGKA